MKPEKVNQEFKGTILFPKGATDNAISLKCCKPKGIPIMVIHNNMPKNK